MSASPTTYCENGSDTRRITKLQKKKPKRSQKAITYWWEKKKIISTCISFSNQVKSTNITLML